MNQSPKQLSYGDFLKNKLTDKSSEMVWITQKYENLNG